MKKNKGFIMLQLTALTVVVATVVIASSLCYAFSLELMQKQHRLGEAEQVLQAVLAQNALLKGWRYTEARKQLGGVTQVEVELYTAEEEEPVLNFYYYE